jgi:hypothetical protein
MLPFLSLLLNLFILSNLNELESVHLAKLKCETKNCMCEVSLDNRSNNYNFNDSIITSNSMFTLYFDDAISLRSYQIKHLNNFILKSKVYKKSTYWPFNISIVSYYNDDEHIAKVRAIETKIAIELNNPSANINIINAYSKEANRLDVVLHTKNNLITVIEKITADYYLIDASKSMSNNWNNLKNTVNDSLKPDSKVFISIVSGCKSDQSFNSIIPHGNTEIYHSYIKLLEIIEPNKSLVVITDFNSSFPVTEHEIRELENLGNKKNIQITILQ